MAVLVAVAVALAVGLLLRSRDGAGGDGDPFAGGLPVVRASWTTVEGHRFDLEVLAVGPVGSGGPGGCIDPPGPGRTNLRFLARVVHRSDGDAPVPDVLFGATATPDGALDASPERLEGRYHDVEVTPRSESATCEDAWRLRPAGRDALGEGEALVLTGTVGGIVSPVPDGMALVVRYVQADPDDPEVASTADLLVPFPATG